MAKFMSRQIIAPLKIVLENVMQVNVYTASETKYSRGTTTDIR